MSRKTKASGVRFKLRRLRLIITHVLGSARDSSEYDLGSAESASSAKSSGISGQLSDFRRDAGRLRGMTGEVKKDIVESGQAKKHSVDLDMAPVQLLSK